MEKYMGVRYLIKEGLKWRIGNGDDINIWSDNRLPNSFSISHLRFKVDNDSFIKSVNF